MTFGAWRDAVHRPDRLPVAPRPGVARTWARVWSQFRCWSRNGTWAQALTVPDAAARRQGGWAEGRKGRTDALDVVIDTHLVRGASNGGFTFHDRGGPYGAHK